MDTYERYAMELLGGIPRGNIWGMQLFEHPDMPSDLVRIVDPVTGKSTDFRISDKDA